MVFDMYPGYNGSRPKMQIYHGSADSTLLPNNYNETIKEWAGVFGYDYTKPDSTKANTPQSGYSEYRSVWQMWNTSNYLAATYTWGDHLTGIYAVGVGHTVPIRGSDDMKYFGL
jgi:acetylxylan esterase